MKSDRLKVNSSCTQVLKSMIFTKEYIMSKSFTLKHKLYRAISSQISCSVAYLSMRGQLIHINQIEEWLVQDCDHSLSEKKLRGRKLTLALLHGNGAWPSLWRWKYAKNNAIVFFLFVEESGKLSNCCQNSGNLILAVMLCYYRDSNL